MAKANVIVFYGPNALRIKDEVFRIKKHFKAKHPQGFSAVVKSEEMTPARLEELFSSQVLFADRYKLVWISDFSKIEKPILTQLLACLDDLPLTTTVILSDERLVKEQLTKLLKGLPKDKLLERFFDLPYGRELNRWIETEVVRQEGKISGEAVERLAVFAGRDLGIRKKDKKSGQFIHEELFNLEQLRNEIAKLIGLKGQLSVEEEDVRALVKPQESQAIFELIDAAVAGDVSRALSLAQGLAGDWERLSNEDALYINNMIASQVRSLLLARAVLDRFGIEASEKLAELTKGSWQRGKSFLMLNKARSFKLPILKKIYQELFLTDQRLKSSRAEPKVILTSTMTALAKQREEKDG